MGAEEGSLFPACSLQGAVQLQRVVEYANRSLAQTTPLVAVSSARRTIASTDILRLASALPYQVPVNGKAWRGSRAYRVEERY